jgi:hypothetical protein
MSRFAEVRHEEWIAAEPGTVQAQFADLEHHVAANVHPKLHIRVLEQSPRRARYIQEVTLLGIRQRDVFEREFGADGSMTDTSVEGFNRGGSLHFEFRPMAKAGRSGTVVRATIRVPLLPVIGRLLRPLLEGQIRRELLTAVAQDKDDLELRGYSPGQAAGPVLAKAA